MFWLVLEIKNLPYEQGGVKEKYMPTITFWHHEAFRVITNDDPKG